MQFVKREQCEIKWRDRDYWVGELQKPTELDYLKYQGNPLCGWFDGVNTMLDFMEEYMSTPRRGESSAHIGRRDNFFTFNSYEEAMDIYKNNPSRVKKFTEVDLALTDLEAPGQEGHYDVTGDYLDIGRYLEGDPEAFGVMYDGNPRARRVNLIINLGWVWSNEERVCNLRSQRIQRLVDWLEARGVPCAVIGINSSDNAHFEVLLKDHGQALDLNDLAVVTHNDFSRRVAFRFKEYSKTWTGGYGHAFVFNNHVSYMKHDNEYSSEFDIMIGNNVDELGKVDREFDDAELKLNRTLGKAVLEANQRFIIMFKGTETPW